MMLVGLAPLMELENAIAAEQLDTYFQPKVDVKSVQVVGVEALVRLKHPIAAPRALPGITCHDAYMALHASAPPRLQWNPL